MNYGYLRRRLLLVPIDIFAGVRPGQTLRPEPPPTSSSAATRMCVPEDPDLSLDLKVQDSAAPWTRATAPPSNWWSSRPRAPPE